MGLKFFIKSFWNLATLQLGRHNIKYHKAKLPHGSVHYKCFACTGKTLMVFCLSGNFSCTVWHVASDSKLILARCIAEQWCTTLWAHRASTKEVEGLPRYNPTSKLISWSFKKRKLNVSITKSYIYINLKPRFLIKSSNHIIPSLSTTIAST